MSLVLNNRAQNFIRAHLYRAIRCWTSPINQSRKVGIVSVRIKRIIEDYENSPILKYLRGTALNLQY